MRSMAELRMSEEGEGAALAFRVSGELRKMFEGIAKLALQGVTEADDPTLNIMEKTRRAHSRVTLVIDDAMRGLTNVNQSMLLRTLMVANPASDDSKT
jgi:hypothetical protein